MSEFAQVQLLPPADWQTFERASQTLWRCILRDDHVHRFGRTGQAQFGLDLTGYRNKDPLQLVGIQCKCVGVQKELAEDVIRADVRKAAAYEPQLSEYIITTTFDDDVAIQRLGQILTRESARAGRNLLIRVWGWSTLQQEILRYPEATDAFDYNASPIARETRERIASLTDSVSWIATSGERHQQATGEQLQAISAQTSAILSIVNATGDAPDHAEIDRIRILMNEGQSRAALRLIGEKEGSLNVTATDAVRSRLKSLAAFCHWHLGDSQTASRLFAEGYSIAPAERRAKSAHVLNALVLDDFADAYRRADEIMRADPGNDVVAPWLLMAAARLPAAEDPSSLIGEEVKSSIGYCESRTDFLRSRHFRPTWWEFAREWAPRHPTSMILRMSVADAELDEFIETTPYRQTGTVPAEWRKRLNDAADVLLAELAKIKNTDNPASPVVPGLVCNLAAMLFLTDRHLEMKTIVVEAFGLFPDEPDVLQRTAQVALELKDRDLEDRCLPRLDGNPQAILIKILILARRGRWNELDALAENKSLGAISGSDGKMARLLVRIASIRCLGLTKSVEARTAIEAALADREVPDEHFVALSDLAEDLGFEDLAAVAYRRSRAAVSENSHIAARLNVALAAESRSDWGAVIDLLDGHIDVFADTHDVRMLARAFANRAPITRRAITFFDNLPKDLAERLPFTEMAAVLHTRAGNLEQAALSIAAARAENENSARLLCTQYQILSRLGGRNEDIARIVREMDPASLCGSPIDIVGWMQVIARHGRRDDALAFAYRTVMQNIGDAGAELLYCGLFLGWPDEKPERFAVGAVADGSWVRIVDRHGRQDQFLIDSELPPETDIVAPSSSRATRFLGLAIGGKVEIDEGMPFSNTLTVAEIKHRCIHAFHFITQTFENRHPGHQGFRQLVMPDGGVEPFLEMLRRRAAQADKAVNAYAEGVLPLEMIGRLTGGTPIDFLEHLEANASGIKTCIGTAIERDTAERGILATRKIGAVMDLTAFWTALRLDLLPTIAKVFEGKLFIPESALTELQRRYDDVASRLKLKSGTAAMHEGRFVMIEHDDTQTNLAITKLDGWIETAKKVCTVVPAVAPDAPSHDLLNSLSAEGHPHLPDAMLVAMSTDAILISEDAAYRELARVVGVARATWMQPLLMLATRESVLPHRDLAAAVSGLAVLKHGHVALDAITLAEIVRGFPDRVLATAAFVGTRDADMRSHISVVAAFASIALREGNRPFRRALSFLLSRLFTARPVGWEVYLAGVIHLSRNRASTTTYVRDWCANRQKAFRPIQNALAKIQTG